MVYSLYPLLDPAANGVQLLALSPGRAVVPLSVLDRESEIHFDL